MNIKDKDADSRPLQDEAKARGEWRNGETLLRSDEGEAGLPASEADDASAVRETGEAEEDGRPGRGRPGDFPPPD